MGAVIMVRDTYEYDLRKMEATCEGHKPFAGVRPKRADETVTVI